MVENRASSLRRQAANQIKQDPVAAESSQTQRPVTPKAVASKTLQTVPEKSSNSPRKIDVGYKFLRSKTTVDMRSSNVKHIVRNEDGVPYITPIQRYELQLLLMEDILKNGISGKHRQFFGLHLIIPFPVLMKNPNGRTLKFYC